MAGDFASLLGTTRGQIVSLLRPTPLTVQDIAQSLHLTPNAVRAHLTDLQQDNLITPAGTQPAYRKPHTLYTLTPLAREHFSRLYLPVLTALLTVLSQKLPSAQALALIADVGHQLAKPHQSHLQNAPFPERLSYTLKLLTDLGAVADIHRHGKQLTIQGQGCPLSEAVAAHPEVCRALETLLADLLDRPVHEKCHKGPNPNCCFIVNVGTNPE